MKLRQLPLLAIALSLLLTTAHAQSKDAIPPGSPDYDLLLKGGHVIDAKNNIDQVYDVAIKDGKIAAIAADIPANYALKAVNVSGMYVTPGLIDIHTHVFWGDNINTYRDGDWSVPPDGFTLRNGVTTIVDAGSSGWRNFPVFKARVIDHSQTRVLAMLNIVGNGMGNNGVEQNTDDMDGKATAAVALKYPGIIVGIKSAHFTGPEWKPYEQAEIAGTTAHIPVMIDFGARRIERPLYELLSKVLRPGDIYTHAFSGERGEQDFATGGPSKAMLIGRQRGIYFDVGHGQASFAWFTAIPLYNDGFHPDSISTDLHIDSMNAGMKDILNVGDKYLAIGMPLQEVIRDMTWNPAREILQTQLGNLSIGAIADVAVISIQHGDFGFDDAYSTSLHGTQKMFAELTIKDGKVVYDLNAITADPWNVPPGRSTKEAKRWTALRVRGFGDSHWRPLPGQPLIKDWTPFPWTGDDDANNGKPTPLAKPAPATK